MKMLSFPGEVHLKKQRDITFKNRWYPFSTLIMFLFVLINTRNIKICRRINIEEINKKVHLKIPFPKKIDFFETTRKSKFEIH